MARYQILYWEYIPIGVKATDATGTVRKNLPTRFQEAFERAVTHNRPSSSPAIYTTSGFCWSQEQIRGGSAADVATSIVSEMDKTWDEAQALLLFEQGTAGTQSQFLDLNRL